MGDKPLNRREFIKSAAVGFSSFAFPFISQLSLEGLSIESLTFPESERLGRVVDERVKVKSRPDMDSEDVGELYGDDIVVWLREVVGKRPLWNTQRFIETPDGFIYSPSLQQVQYRPNDPLSVLPHPDGTWVEVTIPYVDLILDNPPARSPWLENSLSPRLYYSQIMWIDRINIDDQSQTWYRVKDRYGSYGDIFWVPGEALRPLEPEEISPINPEVENKRVEVDLTHQTMSCFEGDQEVFFCRVSTGGKYSQDGSPRNDWATPIGRHTIWRKLVSLHMSGGTTGGGWDLPGIGWTVLFSGQGMAIHSTFWHNSYGIPRSHGCVNASPDDAKWVFRWTLPEVSFEPGEITISGEGSTRVIVKE